MPSVTVPGVAGSSSPHVVVPFTANDVSLVVAQQIAAIVNSLAPNNLHVASITGGSSPPPFGPSTVPGELLIAGAGGGNLTTTSDYDYVVNVNSGPMTINAANQTILSGTVGGTFFDSGNATVAAGGGNNLIQLSGAQYFGWANAGNDTIFGSGSGTIGGGSGANIMSAGSDAASTNMVFSQGTGDFVAAMAGAVTVAASGTGGGILDGNADMTVFNTGTGTTVAAGSGTTNVLNAGSMVFVGGAGGSTVSGTPGGTETLFGGSGSLSLFTGASAATVLGGSSVTTVLGAANGSLVYASTSSGVDFVAGAGSETVNAALSSSNNLLVGGTNSTGSNLLVGGSGNDTLFAGSGAGTLAGGSGDNEFAFFKAATTGNTNFVMDFSSSDSVFLVGYGASQAATALAGAQSFGGSTTLTLSDSTKITFVNVGSAGSLNGHILSS